MEGLQGLLASKDEQALSRSLEGLVGRLGVSSWMYALDLPLHGGSREQYSMGAYPDAWVERYLGEGYLKLDPIVGHCASSSLPLWWEDAAAVCERGTTVDAHRARRMFSEADAIGMGAGLSVPLHGPGNTWGLMSFAAESQFSADLRSKAAELHLLSVFVHEVARGFAGDQDATVAPPELTPRERECLQWAAEGKTSWEIGRLLRISERTAVFHLNNASQKLGVCGRQAAIARAVSLGLVTVR